MLNPHQIEDGLWVLVQAESPQQREKVIAKSFSREEILQHLDPLPTGEYLLHGGGETREVFKERGKPAVFFPIRLKLYKDTGEFVFAGTPEEMQVFVNRKEFGTGCYKLSGPRGSLAIMKSPWDQLVYPQAWDIVMEFTCLWNRKTNRREPLPPESA